MTKKLLTILIIFIGVSFTPLTMAGTLRPIGTGTRDALELIRDLAIKDADKDTFEQVVKDSGGRWYRGIQNFLKLRVPHPITVYYPGCGADFNHAISATNADIFIFVDIRKRFPRRILWEIRLNGGTINSWIRSGNMHVLSFSMWGKERILYYYAKTDTADEQKLPAIMKRGYGVFMYKLFTGYGGYNSEQAIRLGFKYLKSNGFVLADDYSPGRLLDKGGELQTLGTRFLREGKGLFGLKRHFCYFGQFLKQNRSTYDNGHKRTELFHEPVEKRRFSPEYLQHLKETNDVIKVAA